MKISKIPGLGRFGVYIDDVDLNNISDEEWAEIGKIHLESLVTIIRNTDVTPYNYYRLIMKWGPSRWNRPIAFYKKYGKPLKELVMNKELDDEDQLVFDNVRRWQFDKRCPGMVCVTPKKNTRGQSMGIFGDGELLWHSNECGDVAFTPGVALLGYENVDQTATGFCTSPDWYEKQSESFRSELDEMIIIHNYRPMAMICGYLTSSKFSVPVHITPLLTQKTSTIGFFNTSKVMCVLSHPIVMRCVIRWNTFGFRQMCWYW